MKSIEPYTVAGLTGADQIVGVADSGLNDLSCFFYDISGTITSRNGDLQSYRRKVIQYNVNSQFADAYDDEGGHGTHVSGSISGNCLTDQFDTNGMASDSKIAFFDIGNATYPYLDTYNTYNIFRTAFDAGARVHSDSWGSDSSGSYDWSSYYADTFMWDNPEMLIIVAAGNSGEDGFNTVGAPGTGKNVLTVGAAMPRLTDYDVVNPEITVAYFSSLGPTNDGRFGVDLIAPGYYIMSALAGNISALINAVSSGHGKLEAGVLKMSGTSMATPVTSGAALLIRQYLSNTNFWATNCVKGAVYCKRLSSPSAALVKAMLITSCTPAKRYSVEHDNQYTKLPSIYLGEPPDVYQGYGQVYLKGLLPLKDGSGLPANRQLFIYDNLAVKSKTAWYFTLAITDNTLIGVALKVTLAWTDPPLESKLSINSVLMNNVDLVVVGPDSKQYWGNRVQGGDSNNTVEQVYLTVQMGTYKVFLNSCLNYLCQCLIPSKCHIFFVLYRCM